MSNADGIPGLDELLKGFRAQPVRFGESEPDKWAVQTTTRLVISPECGEPPRPDLRRAKMVIAFELREDDRVLMHSKMAWNEDGTPTFHTLRFAPARTPTEGVRALMICEDVVLDPQPAGADEVLYVLGDIRVAPVEG